MIATPSKCGKLSEYTDSATLEVEDLSSRCMNGPNVCDRFAGMMELGGGGGEMEC